ncbi:unnamed protein product [Ilex paraguariensis]|uniref:Uncharacterized protein n=1 Tax=Ilex paraguariensis TaxID=185542 RepID=A0ABC8T4N8_9AQUA
MDGGVGDEVHATMDAIDGSHLQSQGGEYSLKPGSSSMLELHDEISPHQFAGDLDGKIPDSISASEHSCADPIYIDDGGTMVEELTLRNYFGGNMAIVGTSNDRDSIRTRQNQLQHLCQIADGSGSRRSGGDASFGHPDRAMPSDWEDMGKPVFEDILGQNQRMTIAMASLNTPFAMQINLFRAVQYYYLEVSRQKIYLNLVFLSTLLKIQRKARGSYVEAQLV